MTQQGLRLYSYWRSSAAYRVRIALNLKQLPYEIEPVHLARDGGEQHSEEFAKLNPQKFVPVLIHGQRVLRQSMAIIEYLDETFPNNPLMPTSARDRARVRAIAQQIGCDIHPLNNLRILRFFENTWNVPLPEREMWIRHWMMLEFEALESSLVDAPTTGIFCEGDSPSMADCMLVPQLYNARRFGVDLTPYPTLTRIEASCLELDEFDAARPENQPDAQAT